MVAGWVCLFIFIKKKYSNNEKICPIKVSSKDCSHSYVILVEYVYTTAVFFRSYVRIALCFEDYFVYVQVS